MGADNKLDVTWFNGLVCTSTGFPRPQAVVAVAPAAGAAAALVAVPATGAAASVGLGLRQLDMIMLFPPHMFLIVVVWQ